MIALYIILGILLLIFLILLIKVEVFATYTDELALTLKVLFYKKKLLPAPPKPEKKKKAPAKKPKKKKPEKKEEETEGKEKKEKKSYIAKLKDKKGLSGIVSLLGSLAKIAGGMLKGIFSHIVIHKLNVGIALNSGDAASTAVTYGKLCAAVYPSINIIVAATVCKNYNITIEPVFDDDKSTEVYADVHAHLRLIFVAGEAIKAAVKLLIVRIKL